MSVFECLEVKKMRRGGVRHRKEHCAVRGRQICRELCGTVGTVCFHFPKDGKGKRGLTLAGVGVDDPSNEVCEDYRMIYCCRKTDVSLLTFPLTPPLSIKSCTIIISFSNERDSCYPYSFATAPGWSIASLELRVLASSVPISSRSTTPRCGKPLRLQRLRNFPLRDSFTCDK